MKNTNQPKAREKVNVKSWDKTKQGWRFSPLIRSGELTLGPSSAGEWNSNVIFLLIFLLSIKVAFWTHLYWTRGFWPTSVKTCFPSAHPLLLAPCGTTTIWPKETNLNIWSQFSGCRSKKTEQGSCAVNLPFLVLEIAVFPLPPPDKAMHKVSFGSIW